jgi:hypothetical protein
MLTRLLKNCYNKKTLPDISEALLRLNRHGRLAARVTRLGEFSPIGSLFALGSLSLRRRVAQWISHPPQEREDPGSNPAR